MKSLALSLKKHLGLILVLVCLILLRVPNFFEPYWYGDEAIYLTIGNAMNNGARLYTDIVDHKTPLIYYLARVPDQISFRWLNLGWMLVTTGLFYYLALQLFKKPWLATLSSSFFMVLTTVPWLEGNIPNGELFVLGFVMLGLVSFTRTQLWRDFLATNLKPKNLAKFDQLIWFFVSGITIGLGILTKVPAILDLGTVLLIFWFFLVSQIASRAALNLKSFWTTFKPVLTAGVSFLTGVFTPLVASVGYFVSQGTGADYLQFGLLYNLHYTQTWKQDYGSAFLNWAFTLPGKVVLLAVAILLISVLIKKLKPSLQFGLGWFAAALFALLLSNRPYPHYFIQLVPAAALLIGIWFESLSQILTEKAWLKTALGLIIPVLAFWLVIAIMFKLQAGLYDTKAYYLKFCKLAAGQITRANYNHSFDSLVAENEVVASDLELIKPHKMFIWGTNPTLYAQTKIVPANRFTVAFHIQDLKVYDQTLIEIKQAEPEVIIIMNNEANSFPDLSDYVKANYQLYKNYPRMNLYLKI